MTGCGPAGPLARPAPNLQEWTENDLSEEDVTEQVKKEVVPQHMSHFVAAMVLSCVTSNKLQAQRDAFPKLASVLVRTLGVDLPALPPMSNKHPCSMNRGRADRLTARFIHI